MAIKSKINNRTGNRISKTHHNKIQPSLKASKDNHKTLISSRMLPKKTRHNQARQNRTSLNKSSKVEQNKTHKNSKIVNKTALTIRVHKHKLSWAQKTHRIKVRDKRHKATLSCLKSRVKRIILWNNGYVVYPTILLACYGVNLNINPA